MADINISEFAKRIDRLARLYPRLPNLAATIAVKFTKDRFRAQNWIGERTEPWVKRKENATQRRRNQGRAILVKTGRLKRSPRKIRTTPTTAIVGTDVPYAAYHNNGSGPQSTGTFNIKSRRENTRRGTLPRRQFIGESIALARLIERQFTAELIRAIR
jgi:phage gpG-like protein